MHEGTQLSIGTDRCADALQVDGCPLGPPLAGGGRRFQRRRTQASGLQAGTQAERAIDRTLWIGRGLLQPRARARPERWADIEDMHVGARLDGAQHRPQPRVGDDGHRPHGRHAVHRLEPRNDGLAQLPPRLCAHISFLEQ
eukprot:1045632-Prymnesium_polylepis.1